MSDSAGSAGSAPGFVRHGPAQPARAVVVAVPHAGRDYPAEVLANARVTAADLVQLEDRHAERLIAPVVAGGVTAFVATHARAWLDLNRDPRELDAAMLDAPPRPGTLVATAKVRAGLGLVPRRLPGAGELWQKRLPASAIAARVEGFHLPYHAGLGEALASARDRFGAALLLDCHSMPSLPHGGAAVVLGDRFGRSAGGRVVDRAREVIEAHGLSVAINTPYAGAYTLDRHGAPGRGQHALQLEIDRGLYLTPTGEPGPGVVAIAAMIRTLIDALEDELHGSTLPLAAE